MSEAVQTLPQLRFSVAFHAEAKLFFSGASAPALSSRCCHCFTAACLSGHTTPTFNVNNAKFNTALTVATWLSWLRICWNQLPAEERRPLQCVYVGVTRAHSQKETFNWCLVQFFSCICDFSLPRMHHFPFFPSFEKNRSLLLIGFRY